MKKIWCAVLLAGAICAGAEARAPLPTPKPERVAEIAKMLPETPRGVGAKITDRAAWDDMVATYPNMAKIVRTAEKMVGKPFPDLPESLYMVFSKTGNRTRYQNPYFARLDRITKLAMAECVENKGRFIKPLEEILRAVCGQKTWVLPSVDKKLTDYNGKTITIELRTADIAWLMGELLWVMGDKLSPEVRAMMEDRTRKWVIEPHLENLRGKRAPEWWYTGTNNWNAVCLAGTTGAVLSMVESREDRALAIAGAELHVLRFLSGFTADGYCSEGVGYWNYGFGHYIMLSEMIDQATSGKIDMVMWPKAEAPAKFPLNIEILDGVYPAIADCPVTARPSPQYMHFLSKKHGWGLTEYESVPLAQPHRYFSIECLFAFPNSASEAKAAPPSKGTLTERSWFNNAGILVSRPLPGSGGAFGAAMKAGHNAEHHNHNDVGSYVVVSNGVALLLDAGGEQYTARTFSSRRYESQVLNSYGHPVPLVAGKMQRKGRQARGKVLETQFSDEADRFVIDLKACYDVPELKSLVRTFVYHRAGKGWLEVTDDVEFLSPSEFGTAFITLRPYRMEGDEGFISYTADACVRTTVKAEGAGMAWKVEKMIDGKKPTRLGVNLTKPVTKARISAKIVPIETPDDVSGVYRETNVKGVAFDEAHAVTVQAEDFVAEKGGKVDVCPKVGAQGMAFKFWRDKGHQLTWKADLPKAGKYGILLRECQNHDIHSQFQLLVDGADKGLFMMPTTGGWSGAKDDWQSHWIGQKGKLLTVDLDKGEHTITLVNANGRGVNLDWLRFVPVK